MKYYGIYQSFVEQNREKNLLVGKQIAKTKEEAIENHLALKIPKDNKAREFFRGYLQAIETNKESFEKNHRSIIEENKKRLGVWSVGPHKKEADPTEIYLCNRCDKEMKQGKALVNKVIATGSGESVDELGATLTRGGEAVQICVIKCPECGHSFTVKKSKIENQQS